MKSTNASFGSQQKGGAVNPNNREYHRLRLEMKHEAERRKIMRAVDAGELDKAEASIKLLLAGLEYLSGSIEMESKLSKNILRY